LIWSNKDLAHILFVATPNKSRYAPRARSSHRADDKKFAKQLN
jgi:hypothetical protein